MLEITADLHTHTAFSHGKGTPEENILTAISLGLKKIAICDHSYRHIFYGIRKMDEYVETVLSLKEKYKDKIEVLLGIEANLCGMNGEFDLPQKYENDFDIVILGFHKGFLPTDFKSAIQLGLSRESEKLKEKHTLAFEKALSTGKINILAHPGYAISTDKLKLAKICEKYGVLYEINNKHPDLTAEDLKSIAEATKVNFVLSSDAHKKENVGTVPHSITKAEKAGIPAYRIINVKEEAEF